MSLIFTEQLKKDLNNHLKSIRDIIKTLMIKAKQNEKNQIFNNITELEHLLLTETFKILQYESNVLLKHCIIQPNVQCIQNERSSLSATTLMATTIATLAPLKSLLDKQDIKMEIDNEKNVQVSQVVKNKQLKEDIVVNKILNLKKMHDPNDTDSDYETADVLSSLANVSSKSIQVILPQQILQPTSSSSASPSSPSSPSLYLNNLTIETNKDKLNNMSIEELHAQLSLLGVKNISRKTAINREILINHIHLLSEKQVNYNMYIDNLKELCNEVVKNEICLTEICNIIYIDCGILGNSIAIHKDLLNYTSPPELITNLSTLFINQTSLFKKSKIAYELLNQSPLYIFQQENTDLLYNQIQKSKRWSKLLTSLHILHIMNNYNQKKDNFKKDASKIEDSNQDDSKKENNNHSHIIQFVLKLALEEYGWDVNVVENWHKIKNKLKKSFQLLSYLSLRPKEMFLFLTQPFVTFDIHDSLTINCNANNFTQCALNATDKKISSFMVAMIDYFVNNYTFQHVQNHHLNSIFKIWYCRYNEEGKNRKHYLSTNIETHKNIKSSSTFSSIVKDEDPSTKRIRIV